MKKKKGRLPDFNKMTLAEEAHFWDTHDITDFNDELEDVEIVFELDKPRDETLVLRVQTATKEALKKIARSRGLNVSTLARMWIIEKLQAQKT